MEKKPLKPQVAESPVADVFESRHPSEGEKKWAEKTLGPTLEKAPERPIGAPTGVNLDEQGHARFTTISGVPIRRLYTQADLPQDWSEESYLATPACTLHPRHHATIAREVYTMRQFSAFALPVETNQRFGYLLEHGVVGCRLR
jgi:methylmalonyl-CoA mutase N-terminal domain/subunit